MIEDFFEDALFAAIAAIGFMAISNPPRNAYFYCAVIAALGHSTRFILMRCGVVALPIVAASGIAALVVGIVAVILSPRARVPAEAFLFPSLLPMIPGVYAYKSFGGLAMCLIHGGEESFLHYFYLFSNNGMICLFVILAMVAGAVVPIFLLKHISFRATR